MAVFYDGSGNTITVSGGGGGDVRRLSYAWPVHGINHRGYCTVAPENTLPAYQLSASNGFKFVETDVAFTSDDVPVLLHDATINSVARNTDGTSLSSTLNVYDLTYSQLLTYDFTAGKTEYAGTKIARFDDFIALCKRLGLHPYIELKNSGNKYTQALTEGLVDTVRSYDMLPHVTWINGTTTLLGYVIGADPYARVGFMGGPTAANIASALTLMTGHNEVFLNCWIDNVTSEGVALCQAANLPLEVWSFVNSESQITGMDGYISGYTANLYRAEKVLYDEAVE